MATKKLRYVRATVSPEINFDDDPGVTQQQFINDCDINQIVNKFLRGDDISHYQRAVIYGDQENVVPENFDYALASDIINQANWQFAQLPAQDRDYFQNDPQNFIDYMENPNQFDDSIRRGYRIKREPPQNNPTPVPPAAGATPPPDKK